MMQMTLSAAYHTVNQFSSRDPPTSCSIMTGVNAVQIGHFRVAVCLGFEVSLGAQLLKWKLV